MADYISKFTGPVIDKAIERVVSTNGEGAISAENVGAVPADEKGKPSGVATLGEDGIVPDGQLPDMDYVPISDKGKPDGVATLGPDGRIPTSQIPAGSAGLLPQLLVTIAPEVTVTATLGDTTVTSTTGEDGTAVLDLTDYGTWLVRDDLGNSADVAVDNVKQYAVRLLSQIVNYQMLYDAGNECVDITGGWNPCNSGYGTLQKDALSMTFTSLDSGGTGSFYTSETDASAYVGLAAVISANLKNGRYTQDQSLRSKVNCVGFAGPTAWSDVASGTDMNYTTTGYVSAIYGTGVPEIIQKTMYNVSLHYPAEYNGRFSVQIGNAGNSSVTLYNMCAYKADDWNAVVELAGITASNISDVVDNPDNCATLLANQSAVTRMIYTCTGDFMASAIASSTFLEALNASPYKELIYGNPHWAKFLAMVA